MLAQGFTVPHLGRVSLDHPSRSILGLGLGKPGSWLSISTDSVFASARTCGILLRIAVPPALAARWRFRRA
jgi:hypothetical protein